MYRRGGECPEQYLINATAQYLAHLAVSQNSSEIHPKGHFADYERHTQQGFRRHVFVPIILISRDYSRTGAIQALQNLLPVKYKGEYLHHIGQDYTWIPADHFLSGYAEGIRVLTAAANPRDAARAQLLSFVHRESKRFLERMQGKQQ